MKRSAKPKPKPKKAKLPSCGGEKRKGGKCTQPAGWGTQHPGVGRCKLHLGSTPQNEVKGLVELARRDAVMAPLSIEPQDAILECIRIAAGEVAYASERIAGLEVAEFVGPVVTSMSRNVPVDVDELDEESDKNTTSAVEETRYGAPALHVWIVVRDQAMDRLVAYSFAALKAGIAQQLVEISKTQAGLIAQGFRTLVVALGHDPDAPEVRQALRAQLTVLSGGAA
jgi:hypothetical protein